LAEDLSYPFPGPQLPPGWTNSWDVDGRCSTDPNGQSCDRERRPWSIVGGVVTPPSAYLPMDATLQSPLFQLTAPTTTISFKIPITYNALGTSGQSADGFSIDVLKYIAGVPSLSKNVFYLYLGSQSDANNWDDQDGAHDNLAVVTQTLDSTFLESNARYRLRIRGTDFDDTPSFGGVKFDDLLITSAKLSNPADFDFDGDVDGADFLRSQRGLGKALPNPADGDANNDRSVNAADLTIVRQQFGAQSAVPAIAPTQNGVPEPSGAMLAIFGCILGDRLQRAARRKCSSAQRQD
jgi:hypothetical protein